MLEEGGAPEPLDPITEDGRTDDIIDMLVEHFTSTEEYERCAELVKIKSNLNEKI